MSTTGLESVLAGVAVNENANLCIATLDSRLRVLEANDELLERLGHSQPEIYGEHFGNFIHASVESVVLRHLDQLVQGRHHRFDTKFFGPPTARSSFSGGMTGIAVRGSDRRVSSIVLLVNPGGPAPVATDLVRTSTRSPRRKLLSDVDAKVLEGIAAGCSNVHLAGKLCLSRQGVEYHVSAMLRRFKCQNRPALVAKAYSQGVLCIGQWPPRVVADYVR